MSPSSGAAAAAVGTGWLELTLDFRSNLRCVGCFACGDDGAAMDLATVGAWLQWGRTRGLENLWLGGGEPTLRPDLGKIVRAAKRLGYRRVLLQTNGMRLSQEAYAAAVIRAGVDTVSLNLKSVDAEVHDRLSGRTGAFELLEQACAVLASRPIRVVGDLLLTRSTLERLPDTIAHYATYGVERFWLWLLSVADTPVSERAAIDPEVPSPPEVAEALVAARAVARELGVTLKSLHSPECWLPTEARDIVWSAAALDLWVANPGQPEPMRLEASAMEGGAWLPRCVDCAARVRCGGPREDTLELFGSTSFVPIAKAVSNAFHHVLEDGAGRGWPTEGVCPELAERLSSDTSELGQAVEPDEPSARTLFFLDSERQLRRAVTTTGDFNEPAIAHIKDEIGQLYLDVSDKPAPTDFAADLQRLVPVQACGACSRRTRCGRAFRAEATDVFGRDDAAVRDRIDELRGVVVDIGAGHGPYVERFEPLVNGGRVDYTAVEPHAGEAEALAQRAPWAKVQVAPAEALAVGADTVDHALILRSYNHLVEVERVLGALVVALKTGGTLLVVDNVAFALVRTKVQADRAEQGPAVFEHTRNDGAPELVALVRAMGLPLEIIAHQDVGSGTSNQWLVEFRKTDAVLGPVRSD